METVRIELVKGWNLFSFNVTPDDSRPEVLLASIEGQYKVVRGFDEGSWTYYPNPSSRRTTLEAMDPYHGYWIKMNGAATLTVTGEPVAEDTPLLLNEGWNSVSYLPEESTSVSEALSSIDGMYTAVLGFEGRGLSYYPQLSAEMNSLQDLTPGHGYWIRMSAPAILVYGSE